MGLGLIGAGGAVGAQNALQKIRDLEIAAQLRQQQPLA